MSATASPKALTKPASAGAKSALFWWCTGLALLLHLSLYARASGLQGGADLQPHLRLIQQLGESPVLRSVYPPAYHGLGALLTPWIGLAVYPSAFAFCSALALLLGFRFFQRSAALPDESAALFALLPYPLAMSWCIPKVEFAGLALVLFGLGWLIRGRYWLLTAAVTATFAVHTAAALVFGLVGLVLAVGRRDLRALAALFFGALGATPLLAVHLLDGCSWEQALLLTRSGYLGAGHSPVFDGFGVVAALAAPLVVALAVPGGRHLWRNQRSLAWACLALLVVGTNAIWLAPFGLRTGVDLIRGLSLVSIAVAIPAGFILTRGVRLRQVVLGLCALWLIGCTVWAMPRACHTRPISLVAVNELEVARCQFAWIRVP